MTDLPSINATGPVFAPIALTPQTPPLTCACQLILERVYEMVRYEEGTRAGDDIEALHDMRVWSRRLREALEIFQFVFPKDIYQSLYQNVRQVTKTLGKARNADVAVDFFAKRLSAAKAVEERFALEDLLRQLVEIQTDERKRMQKKLDKKVKPSALPAMFESSFRKLADKSPAKTRGPRTALRLARTLLIDRLNLVFKTRQQIAGEADIEALHNLRITVKKLRYAIEVLHFTAGAQAPENLKYFKKLQTVLGDIHDRDVFAQIVRDRCEALQKLSYAAQLLKGYDQIFKHLMVERHELYLKYEELFSGAKLTTLKRRVVPPARLGMEQPAGNSGPSTPAHSAESSAPQAGEVAAMKKSSATATRRQTKPKKAPAST